MRKLLKDIFILLLFVLSFVLLFVLLQTQHIWGDVYIEQILINLSDGVSVVSNKLIIGYVFSIIMGIVSAMALSVYLKNNKQLLFISFCIIAFVFYKIGIFSYIFNKNIQTKIYEEEYINPENSEYTFSSKKRNLIVIYLESMETNYASSPYLKENLIPNIDARQKAELSFDGFYQLRRQDYTMAAMVESMCAVPYRQTILTGHEAQQNFLAGLTCYPQILQKYGYQTVFMKGADIDFALTGLFMRSHGFENVMGKKELEEKFQIPLDRNKGSFGGYRDSALYEMVKLELKELSASEKPFALSFLTLDTHAPDYFLDPDCPNLSDKRTDIVRCADTMLNSFLNWLQKQDFYWNTTVVVLGDHPETGKNAIYPKEKNRQIVNFILNPFATTPKEAHSAWTTLDIPPTILSALGINFDHGKFGLGRSLFAKEPTLLEKMGLKLETELSKSSEIYNTFETVKIKSFPKYHLYTPFALKVSSPEEIAHYATYSNIIMNIAFLDELSFLLPQTETKQIVFNIQFKIMISDLKEQAVKIFANGVLLEQFNVFPQDSALISKKINIPTNLLKNQKLLIRFETDNNISHSDLFGIGVLNFSFSN